MRKVGRLVSFCFLALGTLQGAQWAEFTVLFGFGDSEPADWAGSIEATGARVAGLEGWRFEREDAVDGSGWRLATRRVNLTRSGEARREPPLENGVFVRAEVLDAAASFEVRTAQGNFSFRLADLRWGAALTFLDGRARVERVPLSRRLTESIEEQDFPALAAGGGKVYLAYTEFTHGNRDKAMSRQLTEKPESFEALRQPAGGDRVWLMERPLAGADWSRPEAVTDPGQDVYRTAVAVDGRGRVWVIWSAQVGGNFDLYARYKDAGRWSRTMRVTRDAGPDLSPAAVTASDGAVWVAWQGYRDNFDVLVARQEGDGFSAEQRVSVSGASDWAPQIAAGPNGEVAVVWDTYEKGDYDVYARRLRFSGGVKMEAPEPVAASQHFEARASAAYGRDGMLWVAWEDGYPAWGKDFGAYETTGTGLYQASHVRLKALQGGKQFRTDAPLDQALDRLPASHPVNKRLRGAAEEGYRRQPDPEMAANRRPSTTPYDRYYPSKGYPRLAASPDGTVFLAYRNAAGRVWGPLGTAWFENVVYFDGAAWHGPVFAGHTDGLLDMRPALLGLEGPKLLMASAGDHRFEFAGQARRQDRDIFNHDVVFHEFEAGGPAAEAKLAEMPLERPAAPMRDVTPEKRQVALMRDYRVKLGSENLQLLRGEFHRHTSISGDGGNDGDIIDAFRYLIDAAYMDWAGCCDHDNGGGREYPWWITQKMTDAFWLKRDFVPMFSYERSVRYPEGHRNVIFSQRGVRPLPRLPKTADDSPPDPAPDTQMLYDYLRAFDGIAAVHTSGTNMGTDWRDNDPVVEPVVEIYQGDRQNYEIPGGPRSNTENDSIGGWRPLGFVSNALAKGYRLAFQASSDHISTHMSYANVWVGEPTREAILDAFKKRRVYGATDNILADVRCAGHFMGEEFLLSEAPKLDVKLTGAAEFARVHVIKDNQYVYTVEPGTREVEFSWRDSNAEKGKTSYYYVRGEQADGEIVWVSPMWITVR